MTVKLTFRKAVLTIILCCLTAAPIIYLFSHIGINKTDSVDFKLYWHREIKSIEKGRYYLINFADNSYSGLITKKVVCLPADELTRVKNDFLCNGEYIAKIIIEASPDGDEYPQYYPNNVFKGYFVVGDAVNSYDSRYFGVLSASVFKREVAPLY